MKNRVVHFEIQAEDIERAKKFYGEVFGWEFQGWPMGSVTYWAIVTAPKESSEPGINGGFVQRPCPPPKPEQGTNAFTCTIQVENFDEIAKKIEVAGGKVAMPKFALPGMAWQGYFLDTEGNTFGLHQVDTNAK
ncbi:MAG: glyoxalase/bleomycin resistance protein/dioxygenase [Parcubacteria group bacterium Gr01-1014_20]|nr:MAG: glyoxalase/bleomycin resistance protein/dioxygenase [Parcubacteria group bacterium Gr01-1014_20]